MSPLNVPKPITFLVLITHLLFGTYQFNLENPRHMFVNNVDKSKVFKLKVQYILIYVFWTFL